MIPESTSIPTSNPNPDTRLTLAEFRQLPETSFPTELIDGMLIVSPTPTDAHQGISLAILRFFIKENLPGVIRHAPADVYIGDNQVLQPDVFWISPANTTCHLIDGYWHGAPDLVVEILSPSTARQDRGRKYDLYEQYGVREYWLIDVVALIIEVYALENGKFARRGVFGADERFTSSVLKVDTVTPLIIPVAALFER